MKPHLQKISGGFYSYSALVWGRVSGSAMVFRYANTISCPFVRHEIPPTYWGLLQNTGVHFLGIIFLCSLPLKKKASDSLVPYQP